MRCTVHVLENCGKINPAKFSIWTCFSGSNPANHFKIVNFSGFKRNIKNLLFFLIAQQKHLHGL